jgi:magnesium chelatase subunit I
MIILQEAKISKSVISSFLLKTLANLVQKTRTSHQVNQERGVSVRIGIHGLEILVSEAERTRTLNQKITPIPRLSDFHSLDQVAKFELSEMDDNLENRKKIFHELMTESIKETCLGLLKGVDAETLELIKQEFGENTFQVSQQMTWKNGQVSYSNQIEDFKHLKNLIESKFLEAQKMQDEFKQKISSYGIEPKMTTFSELDFDELYSTVTEILLEGLCWVTPKILDKRDAGYVAA